MLEKEKDTSLSIPSLEKQDRYKFVLEGINIEVCDSEEYEIRLRWQENSPITFLGYLKARWKYCLDFFSYIKTLVSSIVFDFTS